MKIIITILLATFTCLSTAQAQDTYSIVAIDTATRQVGSAGASCVDLFNIPGITEDFLSHIIPDSGAINTQAAYTAANQDMALSRMRAGDNPQEVIDYITVNDANGTPSIRQYGIVAFKGTSGAAAAYTGSNCMDYKNHITGNIDGFYYSIQGNILLGQQILTQMESNFRNTQGSLACRLMAAMQGANVVGADTRCAGNNTSALFAFLKISKPTDAFGNPSILVKVKTRQGDQKEPIDSLQTLFDLLPENPCGATSKINDNKNNTLRITNVFPNPVLSNSLLTIDLNTNNNNLIYDAVLINTQGQAVNTFKLKNGRNSVSIGAIAGGSYLLSISHKGIFLKSKAIVVK